MRRITNDLDCNIRVTKIGRTQAAELVKEFAMTHAMVISEWDPKDIIRQLEIEYRDDRPRSSRDEVRNFCQKVLTTLASKSKV